MVRYPALLILVGQCHLLPLGLSPSYLSARAQGGCGLDEPDFGQDNHRNGVPGAALAGVSVL